MPSNEPSKPIRLWVIYYTHMTQGVHTTLPFVLSAYMVRDFLAAEAPDGKLPSEERVGALTGLLGASFCAAQLFTSYPLGIVSDHIGRIPILMMGNVSSCLGVIAYGVSGSYAQAVAARAVSGLFNAIIGAEKAMLGECLPASGQAKAMSLISLVWGIGMLVGPVIGGLLAHPCGEQGVLRGLAAVCSANSLLRRRPYLLPCLSAALLSLLAIAFVAFFLTETRPRRGKTAEGYSLAKPDEEESQPLAGGELEMTNVSLEEQDVGLMISRQPLSGDQKGSGSGTSHANGPPVLQHSDKTSPWYRQRNVILSLTGYGCIAFAHIVLDELIPIFASSPVTEGGLGFPTSSLAPPLAFSGVTLIAWAWWGYPWLTRRIGVVRTCIWGLIQTVPAALFIPMASASFAPASATMWLALGAKSIAATNAFTSCLVLVNAVAPAESLGAVNGVGQTIASGVRALGPALGGVSWAASLRLFRAVGGSSWGHQFMPFAMAAVVSLATIFVYRGVHLEAELLEDVNSNSNGNGNGNPPPPPPPPAEGGSGASLHKR